ncbi:PspC domain-containing protein [Cohnella sp. AR92]|uniref:PspC domain-containing protein n=1 Tax=Cohnella sp. AR92 TaxID=648716 RepID=UPI000F8D5E31|nr:PspC domain-containing protein [Cohnella sp. AR92]RUS46145.1 PspC domain-containing protein [Cohnella sp. AR92]
MRKLYRSSHDSKIFGICGGLAAYFGIDATLLRILTVVVAVFSGGSIILVYILAGFIIPKEPTYNGGFGPDPYGPTGASKGWGGNWNSNWSGGGYNAWTPPGQRTQAPPSSSNWAPGSPWTGPSPTSSSAPGGYSEPKSSGVSGQPPTAKDLDAMMEDIEKKALRQEIEDLKARLTKFEQQSKGE